MREKWLALGAVVGALGAIAAAWVTGWYTRRAKRDETSSAARVAEANREAERERAFTDQLIRRLETVEKRLGEVEGKHETDQQQIEGLRRKMQHAEERIGELEAENGRLKAALEDACTRTAACPLGYQRNGSRKRAEKPAAETEEASRE